MPAATMQQAPDAPPSHSRVTDKDSAASLMPKVPPRPVNKRIDRSVSPNPDRFARSPLHGEISPKDPKAIFPSMHHVLQEHADEPVEKPATVGMPSVGEEGMEYSAVTHELHHEEQNVRSLPVEQTRTIANDLKLHAPKPSLPAVSAKQQVMAVTRTDSEKAASFGIGRPASDVGERSASRNSVRKRPSSIYSNHSDHTDDEHGIPEIGQRVPMNPHLGDVQAPSPGPGAEGKKRHHNRKHSARSLPPGSYGLHGHGVASQDKLDKAYYQKHPEKLEREHHTPLHDRQNDYAMSREDLNKLCPGAAEIRGTPTDDVAFLASEEYAARISPGLASGFTATKTGGLAADPQMDSARSDGTSPDSKLIHVGDTKHPEYYSYGAEVNAPAEEEEEECPILASDEVSKEPKRKVQHPAVRPLLERRRSSTDDETSIRPASRLNNSIRLTVTQSEYCPTPLEDVEEYEPLFHEESKEEIKEVQPKQEPADDNEGRHQFPSKDVWEDAPSSVHVTATVSTPDVSEQTRRRSSAYEDRPITPAQAFAQYQEQLAEKEANGRVNNFTPIPEDKPTWIGHQSHLKGGERPVRPTPKRFPSRDIWEDAPDSHHHEATISGSPTEEDGKPEVPARPTKKASRPPEPPVIHDRSVPSHGSGDELTRARPPVSDKPKPLIPARPSKSPSRDPKDSALSKPKPPVPSRPVGGKIAALQAGFMSDLNKRLQLGPQAPKKEDTLPEADAVEEKEKAPLLDARKGRARGPQRRAPAKSLASAADSQGATTAVPTLSICLPQVLWTIDPGRGDVTVGAQPEAIPDMELNLEHAGVKVLGHPEESDEPEPERVKEPRVIDEQRDVKGIKSAEGEKSPSAEQEPEAEAELAQEKAALASTVASETVLAETVTKENDEAEPVEVHDDVKA
ncbi:hypothetical protein DCS_07014 [Drechmeria coniospora]|uniref:Altered inheritance of mitochondria protein 21 n=1 Tax=Drechmeria coniospora TaxID=98403 RepID=A0A151GDC0_DRECN|nr:hypothetical protein DCS_07014 [Drechmeria coniospora]KYK55053.1 hypothetical protein DCS_07014 [Drechmeria coniospora]